MTDRSTHPDYDPAAAAAGAMRDEAAARWAAVLASGLVGDADRAEFDSWIAADVVHTVDLDRIHQGAAPIREALERGTTAGELYRRIPAARLAAPAYTLTMPPATRSATLVGPRNMVAAAIGETVACRASDGTQVRLAPATRVEIAFDGFVRTLRLETGCVLVERPEAAPGVLFLRPATGGSVRVEAGSVVALEIGDATATCRVARGSAIVTMAEDDILVPAGESAVFDDATARCAPFDPRTAFAIVDAAVARAA